MKKKKPIIISAVVIVAVVGLLAAGTAMYFKEHEAMEQMDVYDAEIMNNSIVFDYIPN